MRKFCICILILSVHYLYSQSPLSISLQYSKWTVSDSEKTLVSDGHLPIVFCHGFLGWGSKNFGGRPYFVSAAKLKAKNKPKYPLFLFPSTGPFSSLHDQACELFFQLKGGLTDYGSEHSAQFHHYRYARFYGSRMSYSSYLEHKYGGEALYPQWDSNHPLHFVGHSMGGVVVRRLQMLLATDYFFHYCGFLGHTNADWVYSVSTVSGTHNGSHLTWILGADEQTGLLKKNALIVRFLCRLIKYFGEKQNKQPDCLFFFDLHFDQWRHDLYVSQYESSSRGSHTVRKKVSQFYDGSDWAMYDLTPNAMEIHNAHLREFPQTWYFSYQTSATFSVFNLFELPIPFITHFVLFLNALLMGCYRASTQKWKSWVKNWRKNDGMCPTASQQQPYLGRSSNKPANICTSEHICQKGIWNVISTRSVWDHAEIAMMPHFFRRRSGIRFYENLLNQLLMTEVDIKNRDAVDEK